jgi:thiol-disulfide isomerase/thioredoxin
MLRRRTAVLAVATAFGALVLSACGSGGTSGGSADTKFVTDTGGIDTVKKSARQDAPDLEGETLDGERLKLSDYKGEIVVINVWGSWCAPCRLEAKYLVEVAKETEPNGVRFLGINTRDPEKGPAIEFEKDYKVEYPSLYDPTGKQLLRFPKGSLNAQAIPSTIVVDRDGKIAARALQALNAEKLHQMIDPLIAET